MGVVKVRHNFHQARWDEPIIFEMSTPGVRGIIPPEVEAGIQKVAGDVTSDLPETIRRNSPLNLPEVSQKHVLAHWLRLSQETHGSNLGNDISEGTCTMKYNPRVHEMLVGREDFAETHPYQDPKTCQGNLEIMYKFQEMMKEVSGMDHITLQPGGGNHAVYTAASIIRKYWEDRGELEKRTDVITTIFSHPCDAAAPHTAGFNIITIYPDENGIPDMEALKEAVSERTAALFITNPEDIGIFNPYIDEFVKIVHDVGGLCFYDQANANAFLGVARAREAGFDLCHFNVHKTFGAPHGCSGPAAGALCCRDFLKEYLPVPKIEFDGQYYLLNYNLPKSIGKVRAFYGCAGVILRAYAWIMSMGPEWLRECADVSVINNNYMEKKVLGIKGITSAYQDNGIVRMEQIRYSFEKMLEEIGIGTEDVNRRIVDYGIPSYWTSHHPWVIPEPMTLEPCETYSKDDIDEYCAVLEQISREAYSDPELVKNAPWRSSCHKRDNDSSLDDPEKWAVTWRAYLRKRGQ
ncbi:MAG TPA: aminomethyl-transferring glycine dehydrogenase subunit GcvPB [Clostridia bacterium]|nr:aminomethyl-transferring glycine dehydrogenase subunit GcvPB [Clostridia bacterium]